MKSQIKISIINFLIKVTSRLSNRQIVKISDFIVYLHTIIPNKVYRQFIINNSIVYPHKSHQELKELSKENVFVGISGLIFALKFASNKFRENHDLKSQVRGLDNIKDIPKNKGFVCVTPHLGLITVAAKVIQPALDRNLLIIMRQDWHDTKLENYIRNQFGNNKIKIVKLGGAMPIITETVKSGGVVVLAVDAILPIEHKQKVDFFGHKFDLSTGPAWLAQKLNVPIITGYNTFDKNSLSTEIFIDKPMNANADKTSTKYVENTTNMLAKRLEKYIFDHPGQWYQSDDYFGTTISK
jgi:lauroyl/myristoyl acyltransferase